MLLTLTQINKARDESRALGSIFRLTSDLAGKLNQFYFCDRAPVLGGETTGPRRSRVQLTRTALAAAIIIHVKHHFVQITICSPGGLRDDAHPAVLDPTGSCR